MSNPTLLHGDVKTVTPQGMFHAILCDPPYELGFMGKKWDKSGVAFDPDTWRRLGEFLLPGGFLFAFAGTRTQHRIACAIEDAGFEIRDCICWTFGSGFPKSLDVSKAIDKAAGAKREVVGKNHHAMPIDGRGSGYSGPTGHDPFVTAPATDAAKIWSGYGSALKPAIEPIIIARKRLSESTIANNCIKHGTGALNINQTRVGTADNLNGGAYAANGTPRDGWGMQRGTTGEYKQPQGRWPANLILSDTDDVKEMFPTTGVSRKRTGKRTGTYGEFAGQDDVEMGHNDVGGSASRFFYQVQTQIDESDPIYYCAKAGRSERNAGLDDLSKKPILWSSGTQNPGSFQADNTDRSARNPHPTLKPLDLCRYLAKLILPPSEYAPRRILVPFAGTASEMIGAMQAGWDEIVGIEQEQEYVEIGLKRIAYWQAKIEKEPAQTKMAF